MGSFIHCGLSLLSFFTDSLLRNVALISHFFRYYFPADFGAWLWNAASGKKSRAFLKLESDESCTAAGVAFLEQLSLSLPLSLIRVMDNSSWPCIKCGTPGRLHVYIKTKSVGQKCEAPPRNTRCEYTSSGLRGALRFCCFGVANFFFVIWLSPCLGRQRQV